MNVFVKVVAALTGLVAALALWSQSPLRAALLAILAGGLWVAQSRQLQRPRILVAAAVGALLLLAANFIGPYSLVLFDVVDARR